MLPIRYVESSDTFRRFNTAVRFSDERSERILKTEVAPNVVYSEPIQYSVLLVSIAAGPHLFPFRTQKLSPLAAMVLQG
jgi:hypothetical protein